MGRDGFISDNLVDIRERLRRDYHPAEAPAEPAETPAPAGGKLTDRVVVQRTESQRDARDLEGRLLSELALVVAEQEKLEFIQAKLAESRKELETISQELQNLSGDGITPNPTEIDRLRLRFFRASGSSALREANPMTEPISAPAKSGQLWISLAILAGAAIVAAAVVLSLH